MPPLPWLIDCAPEFRLPARYTITMLGLIAGFVPRFIDGPDGAAGEPYCAYGTDTTAGPGLSAASAAAAATRPVLRITESSDSCLLLKRKALDASRAVQASDKKRSYLSLFPVSPADADQPVPPEDIVAAAFHFLSLHDQWCSSERDGFGRFPAAASLLGKLGLLHRPVVAEYAGLLRRALIACGIAVADVNRYGGRASALCLTHDVDYLSKRSPGFAWREFRVFLRTRGGVSLRSRWARLVAFGAVLTGRDDPPAASLVRMLEAESRSGARATWFVKTGGGDKYDQPFSLASPVLREAFTRIQRDGHELGLHPAFDHHTDPAAMRRERQTLSHASGSEPAALRQHYLRFEYPATWRAQAQSGFHLDSTLGFAEMEGFRNGCCHPFLPYDLELGRVMPIWAMPLHVMDGTLHQYRALSAAGAAARLRELGATVAAHHGTYTLLFHNLMYDVHDWPGWDKIFEEWVSKHRAGTLFAGTLSETRDAWLASIGIDEEGKVQKIVHGG